DPEVHKMIGRAARISDLARTMITRSSNLATNLLLDFIGLNAVREVLDEAGLDGIRIQRGVEDERAFQQGINNEVSADGLVRLFRSFCEGEYLTGETQRQILDVLLAQEFGSM